MNETQEQKKGIRYLKHGMLAQPTTVALTAAPAVSERYPEKRELRFTLDGQPFGLSVSSKNPQWEDLCEAFGEPSAAWVGKRVRLSDGQTLKVVNVEPAA